MTTAVLLTGLAISFNACSEQSPLQPGDNEGSVLATLGKKGGNGGGAKSNYPQKASRRSNYNKTNKRYSGGNMNVPGGTTFHLKAGALTPPPGTPSGQSVTLTMLVEKDEVNNELLFTFGPAGCQFDPPAEVIFNWQDLGSQNAKLYYIHKNGNYIPLKVDDVDVQNKKMTLYIDHFSRYAIGAE